MAVSVPLLSVDLDLFLYFQFDLVCDKSSYPELAQSAHFLGIMIGAFILGSLADR